MKTATLSRRTGSVGGDEDYGHKRVGGSMRATRGREVHFNTLSGSALVHLFETCEAAGLGWSLASSSLK